jgi:hypothetical protein
MTSRLNVRRIELAGSRSRRNSNDALTSSSGATWPQPTLTGNPAGKFRIAALAQPRARSRTDQTQKTTPDGRPVWAVKLTATDTGSNSVEMIWVEVAGDEPKLTLDELALVQGLVFAPWINKKGEIVRNFRADSITVLADARRTQAA